MRMPKATSRPCDELTIRATRPVPECAARKEWVLAAAVLASSIALIDESVVNVALPGIESALHSTLPAMQWILNAYTLCISALLLLGGAAADQFGRRRVFLIGITIFALASVGCGLAPHIAVLILARAVQGVGAALLIPCSLALIGAAYNEKERGAAIGIWSGASAVAVGIGPLLGGWLLDHTSWRMIFLINPLLAAPTIWIAVRHVPESRNLDNPEGLDWKGALLAFAALGSLVYGLISASHSGWAQTPVVAALTGGVVLLVLFILAERSSPAPMVPLALFRSHNFAGINLLTLLLYGALDGALFFLPFLLIQAHGYSATAAGAVYLPFTVVLALLSRWSGGLADRFGTRAPLIVGPVIAGAGFGLLGIVAGASEYWIFLLPMVVLGVGMAITVAPLTTAVVNGVVERQIGIASGINNAVASIASLLFVAILGTVALNAFGRSLDRHLVATNASTEIRAVVATSRDALESPPTPANMSAQDKNTIHRVVTDSYIETIRLVMLIAAALTWCGALAAAVAVGPPKARERPVLSAITKPS
jgi:EmrB/QacA subfamily drug resistance transporter